MVDTDSSVDERTGYERCQYGRVRHSITAKAKGLGNMGGDILSPEKPVFLITNVSTPSRSPRKQGVAEQSRFGYTAWVGS